MLHTSNLDGLLILRLDSPPLNLLTVPLLDRLCAAIAEGGRDPGVRGIVIAGGDDLFSAGADVHVFQQIDSDGAARQLSKTFQDAFQAIEGSSKPIAVALAGTIVGGALELALACHFRVAAEDSRFRMPEVTLGINPGAGGTQRLPRLIGLERSLRMLLAAETVSARTAYEWGLVDALAPAGQLVERAVEFLAGGAQPRRASQLADQVCDPSQLQAAWQQAERLVRKTRPEVIAPTKIVEALRVGVTQSLEQGLACEQQAFAQCMATPAARNKIHVFFASRAASRVPEIDGHLPLPIRRVAVAGMGSMGTGIAHAFLLAGLPVIAWDQNPRALACGTQRISDSLHKQVGQGRLSSERAADMIASLSTTAGSENLGDADLVIESVYEDAEVKRSVLQILEAVCSPETILASNTSTIRLEHLAAGMRHPERLIGMHFFNPAQRMPLVEIIRWGLTPPAVLAMALEAARRLRKTPVVVADREGFLVNRIFVPYLQEAFWLLEEGASAEAVDRAAVEFGFPMGPFVLMDMAGLDILVDSQRVLQHAFPHHGPLSSIAIGLSGRGFLGQKSGEGVYRYQSGDVTPRPSEIAAAIVRDVQHAAGRRPRNLGSSEITERLVLRMVNEAWRAVDEGVAQRETDVDVAMVLGTGFPDFRGGVLKYAGDLGRDRVLDRLEELSHQFGTRFQPGRTSKA